ncbi:hypothetical protein U1Q18_006859 [Sarracenia purpurea var. burkii]
MNSLTAISTARIDLRSRQFAFPPRHRSCDPSRTSVTVPPSWSHRAPRRIVCMAEPYLRTKLESAEKTWKELSVVLVRTFLKIEEPCCMEA